MIEIIQYIITFLLGDQATPDQISQIGYTSNPDEFHRYKLVIHPSSFFDVDVYGTHNSLPHLPLQIWEETPILFGTAHSETINDTLVIHADLVASTYFLISRYEEMVRRDVRDLHERFPGKESLPFRAGFIDSPLIEEYGKILRAQLKNLEIDIPEPPKQIKRIYFTHDLDFLQHYRSIRGFLGGLLRGLARPKEANKAIKSFWGGLKYDPWYTFPWLFYKNKSVQNNLDSERCKTIVFIRSGGGLKREDQPSLVLHTPDFQTFFKLCKKENVILGLHSSYEAGILPKRIKSERRTLSRITRRKIVCNRHHFLNSREPEDMEALISAGITHDFTMGYADVAGFRLGTCRAVRWINPLTKELTPLVLHPLTVMDGSLSDKRYMYLNAHDAYEYCVRLIEMVENWNGELVLLWHNTSVEDTSRSYHRDLYTKIIDLLKAK